jgi:hypothetical protein
MPKNEYYIHVDTAEYWLLEDKRRNAPEIDEILIEIEDGHYSVEETEDGLEVTTTKGHQFLIKE